MKTIIWLLGCACLTSSCVTDSGSEYIEDIDLIVQSTDVPDQNTIALEYINAGDRLVCIDIGEWPNSAGKLNQASDIVSLRIEENVFPIVDFNTGMCFGEECTITIAPGERISGYLLYEDFKFPERYIHSKKELTFSPPAYICK